VVSAQRFPAAPFDRPTRLVTLGTSLLVGFGIPLLSIGEEPLGAAILGGLGFAIVLGAFGCSPGAYEVEGATLRVRRRLFGSVAFTLAERPVRAPWTMGFGGVRLGGSGGLFGWYGPFAKPGIGRYRAYLTDRSRIVACATDRGLVVVSPADPDAFLAATRRLPRS
jgi:hypothetical protein